VGSSTAAYIALLDAAPEATAGTVVDDAILFRVTDASGIVVSPLTPTVTVVSGGGSVLQVNSQDAFFPACGE